MTKTTESEGADRSGSPWRDQKKRATAIRIVHAGVSLFLKQGYDATTLDQIASEAGISRRSFFSYFDSKEALLGAWPEAGWGQVTEEIARAPRSALPLLTVREAILNKVADLPNEELVVLSRLLRLDESAGSGARHFGNFGEREKAVHLALATVWPHPKRQRELSLVAMITVGAFRLAVERWQDDPNGKPLVDLTRESFRALEKVFQELQTEATNEPPSSLARKRPS